MTTLLSRVALITVAAVAVYAPALGLPLPESCAGPSPSCGGDLRECLRQSADMRQTTFGGRYVTAEDVARCVEAFNSCIHGGAGGGGDPVPPTSVSGRSRDGGALPQRFGIGTEHFDYDCTISGSDATCETTWKTAPPEVDSFTQEITGSVSGMTLTGTAVARSRYHNSAGCTLESNDTHPISFAFSADGTVTVHSAAYTDQVTYSCPTGGGTNAIDAPAMDFTGKWSAKP